MTAATTNPLKPALREQLGRILEETAFMLVEESDASLPDPVPAVEAGIAFSGQQNGTCWLAVSEEGACHLAKEMLGDEGASDPNQCEQATGELLNILTAWVLDTWWGSDVEHRMGTPMTARKSLDETRLWSVPEEQRVVALTDAGHFFLFGVTTEE